MPPADPASRAGVMPKASGHGSSGTLGKINMSPENHILFDRWVVTPLASLRAIPRGDGAFGTLAISFGLYERFLASCLHKQGNHADDNARWEEASKDFDRKVSPDDFKRFWEMYRVGIQHYFHPKHFTKGANKTRWGWDMSEGSDFKPYPVITQKEEDLFIISINPFSFSEHVVKRWYEFSDLMDELSATKLGDVRTPSPPTQKRSQSSYNIEPSTYIETQFPSSHSSTGKWPG